jgi:Secretion system C-terminal sorting domain
MKFIFLFLFLSIFCLNLSGQTEFMPLGSTLHTEASALGFYGSAVFNAQKDTLCNGQNCRKITIDYKDKRGNRRFTNVVYFQQRGDSIFEYNEYLKKSGFLFKNKYAVGDSFLIQRLIGTTNVTEATIYIDSVITFNGIKRYVARINCRAINADNPSFTNNFNLYDRFIPNYNWDVYSICKSAYYDGMRYTPLCYSDNVTNYKSIYYNGSCDSIRTITNVKEIDNDVKISPNPAHSFLTITGTEMSFITVIIKNINGVELIRKTISLPNTIDINDLPNGVYYVSLQNDKGFLKVQKSIIQH